MSLLLGASAFAASKDAARRQAAALASWRALSGVSLANLQWPDEVFEVDGFATHPVLRLDSRAVTGRAGPRKPVVSEMLDALAEIAAREGRRWIGYANSDVHVTPAAVRRVIEDGRSGYAFSRMDFDARTGEELGMTLAGVDALVVSVDWWRANRRRFRAYVAGEPVWDNVYTSILLSHSDAVLLNREPLIRHEAHAAAPWRRSPFAEHTRLLAALDRPYFTLWARYHDRLLELRARGASEGEEMALQRAVFRHAPSPADRAVQAARALKARLRWLVRGRSA